MINTASEWDHETSSSKPFPSAAYLRKLVFLRRLSERYIYTRENEYTCPYGFKSLPPSWIRKPPVGFSPRSPPPRFLRSIFSPLTHPCGRVWYCIPGIIPAGVRKLSLTLHLWLRYTNHAAHYWLFRENTHPQESDWQLWNVKNVMGDILGPWSKIILNIF